MQFLFFEDLLHFLTLKLSAVIPAPTGTVYMLLGDEWRQPEERRQFDCHKLFSRRVLKARRFGSKYLTASISLEWVSGGIPQ